MAYEKLKKEIEKRGLPKCALAMKCGINPSALYNALNGKTAMWPKYKKSISDFLGMSEEELFIEECGPWIKCSYRLPELINDVKGEYTDVELWLESDPVLVYSDSSERIQVAILSAFDTLDEKDWINVENLETITCVTHWMPLPNRPEEV